MSSLRRLRLREMVRIAWRDLAGRASLDATLRETSSFADETIRGATPLRGPAPDATPRCARQLSRCRTRRARDGQARRRRAQFLLRRGSRVPVSGGWRDDRHESARPRGVLRAAGSSAHPLPRCGHRRGHRPSRRHAPSSVRRQRPAGRELRRVRGLPAEPRSRLGALCVREGARRHRSGAVRQRRGRRAARLRLSPISRLRRVRFAARDEGADRAQRRASRARGGPQARSRRHPRDRVRRAGLPAHSRRAGPHAARALAADGAAAPERRQAAARIGGDAARCRVRLPATTRESRAGAGRPAGARAASTTR